ncbi:MAG: ABC transporter permease [Planctomycetota bacterium]|jgi:ABC-type transport system involved in multi-copper enzyme maturation permease subunit
MIAKKTLREIWPLAVIYLFVIEAILAPPIFLWPDLRDVFEKTAILDKFLVADFMKRWKEGVMAASPHVAYVNFMAIQVFFKGANICGIAAAVLLGTGIIARERENQTLEFLLARPVSRAWILWSKFWVTAVVVVVPIFLSAWSAIPLSWEIGETLPFGWLTLAALHNSVFVLMILAFTTLCSVYFSNQLHTAATVGTVVIVQLAIYFIQEVRVSSLFRLSDFDIYGEIVLGNTNFSTLFWGCTFWLLLATVLLYIAADWLFRRANP